MVYSSYHLKASRAVLVRDAFKIKAPASCVSKKSKVSQIVNKWQMPGDCVKASKEAEKKAWNKVESTLDIVRLVREMATLRFILEALFNTSQRQLIPTAMIVAATEEVDLRELFIAENISSSTPSTQKLAKINQTIPSQPALFQTHINKMAIDNTHTRTQTGNHTHTLDAALARSLRSLTSNYILQTVDPVMSASQSTSRPMKFDVEHVNLNSKL